MTLRTKLIIAFALLAVAPLVAIVGYSYATSQRAFRETVERDAEEQARGMAERMALVRRDVDAGLRELSSRRIASLSDNASARLETYLDFMSVVEEMEVDVQSFDLRFDGEAALSRDRGGERSEGLLLIPSRALASALEKMERFRGQDLLDSAVAASDVGAMIAQVVRPYEDLTEEEKAALDEGDREIRELFGTDLGQDLLDGDEKIGRLRARIEAPEILRTILASVQRRRGELPFALGPSGNLYVASDEDRQRLEEANLLDALDDEGAPPELWILGRTHETVSGLVLGIARPIREALEEERARALRSFTSGLLMVALALLGILGIATRLTRNLARLTAGAEQVASGDLTARVPVHSRDELGQLAGTFNRMAASLAEHNRRIFLEEKRRRDQEVQQRLLEAENARQAQELEDARELQLSLLPKELPVDNELEVAASIQTATEVGGDYYDFYVGSEGGLMAAIGDATGHGAKAGILVTFIKGLFTSGAVGRSPAGFLDQATREVRRLDLHRLHMALTVVSIRGRRLRISAAGMPPALLARDDGSLEEIQLDGMPLGGLHHHPYADHETRLESGDCLLLMTDGLPELLDEAGEMFGYSRVRELFASAADQSPGAIVAALADAADRWRGGAPLHDDMTLLAIGVRHLSEAAGNRNREPADQG